MGVVGVCRGRDVSREQNDDDDDAWNRANEQLTLRAGSSRSSTMAGNADVAGCGRELWVGCVLWVLVDV